MATSIETIPNHHADYPCLRGANGVLAAVSMLFGRGDAARLAIDTAGLTSGQRALDIGCGPGVAVRMAARHGAKVVGVDPAPVMLWSARLVTFRRGIRWTGTTAEALPLDDSTFDAAWSLATVHHWNDIALGLREVRRVLVSGGRFVAIERRVRPGASGHASHGWTDQQADAFAEACTAAGFGSVVATKTQAGKQRVLMVSAIAP